MEQPISSQQLRMTVFASMFAALTAAGAQLMIPVGPVPIVMQNFFIMLAGVLLGSRWGLASVCIYLFIGACGMPVFAGLKGGIGHFAGPTGGYLLGYLPAVYVMGRLSETADNKILVNVIAMVCGSIIVYACGAAWLLVLTKKPFIPIVATGVLPFVPGDIVKIAAAVPVVRSLKPIVK